MVDLNVVAAHYREKFRARAHAELASFASEKSLADAIVRAGVAEQSDGRRYSHQYRLKRPHLENATKKLLKRETRISATTSFLELYDLVDNEVGHLDGIGELYVYDTTLRIGAKLGLTPVHIYMHAGTRSGALALGIKSASKAKRIFKFDLPEALRPLEPHEIEDVLCIYKAYFLGDEDLDDPRACWLDELEDVE